MKKIIGVELSKKSRYEWINRNIGENGKPELYVGEVYDKGKLLSIKKEVIGDGVAAFYDLNFEGTLVRFGDMNIGKVYFKEK